MGSTYEAVIEDIICTYTNNIAESIAKSMWQCEESHIVNLGMSGEPNELFVLASIINGYAPEIDYDSGQYLEDIVKSMIEEETKNIINDLSDYLKFVFKAWDDEHEEEPDLLSYNMVYSKVCRRADEECLPPDEWAEDKYWWSFRNPLDDEVEKLREKVDYDDARNMFITDVIAVAREQFKELSKYSVKVLQLVIQCKEVDCYDAEQYSTKEEIFDLLLGHVLDTYLEKYF